MAISSGPPTSRPLYVHVAPLFASHTHTHTLGDLGSLLRGVMVEAKNMTSAERCSLFLIDEYTGELVSKVFDGDEATHEFRIAAGQGIAGNVAQTGKLLNIRDVYTHPLFYKGVDEQTGFKTRCVCVCV